MNLPPFVQSKAFWEAVSVAVAGTLALLAYFGVVDSSWAVPVAVISGWIFSFLRMFGIEPELRAQALQSHLESLVQEYETVLLDKKAELEATAPRKAFKKSHK